MKALNCFLIVLILISHGCVSIKRDIQYGEIVNQGLIEAFPFTTRANGKPKTFEPSSVYENSGAIYLISDKKPPKGKPSSMVKFSSKLLDGNKIESSSVTWVRSKLIKESRKIEAVTKTIDGKYTIATTAFNRPKDQFKMVLFWPSDNPEKASILNTLEHEGVTSSMDLYLKFKSALARKEFPEGPTYFKIEALSVLNNDRIIFGIREIGKSRDDYIFSFILIEAQLKISSQEIKLTGPFKVVYEFDPKKNGPIGLKMPLGLSSIEYSPSREGLFLLTSYEMGEEGNKILAGYLWFLSLSDLNLGRNPRLITKKNGSPLEFEHKSEGLCILDEHRLLIIHDDDREIGVVSSQDSNMRSLNQAVFSIVKIF